MCDTLFGLSSFRRRSSGATVPGLAPAGTLRRGWAGALVASLLACPLPAAPTLTVEEPAGHALTLGVDTLIFGRADVGGTTPPLTVTIRNTGSDPLTVSDIVPTGDLAGDFAVSFTGPAVVAGSGGQTTFGVSFTPQGPGLRTARLQISSDDPTQGTAEVFLSGRGNDPQITVEWPAGTVLSPATSAVVWGGNGSGQSAAPASLNGIKAVAAGRDHSLVVKSDGSVLGWGKNDDGQATPPAGLTDVRAVAAGGAHSIALDERGTVTAWGANADGQSTVPAGLARVVAIAAGGRHSLALRADGTVVAWGANDAGQATVPAGLAGVASIAAGESHSLAARNDGTVIAWGSNDYGQTAAPPDLATVQAIAAGSTFGMALKSSGSLAVWGKYWDGADYVPVYLPAGLSNVKAIAAGGHHLVALKNNGTLLVWGYSDQGQGDVPADLTGVQQISAGGSHTIALPRTAPVIDFGDQITATSSAPRTVTVRNAGGAPLNLFGLSVTGGNSADFQTNAAGLSPTLEPALDATTFTVRFNPGVLGARRTTLRLASDDPDESLFDIALTGTGVALSPMDTWRQAQFGFTSNTGIGADLADPDNDGLVNLLEFAFALNPKKASASPLPPPQWTGDSAVLAFDQPATVAGITYRAEWSPSLTPNSWAPVADAGSGLHHIFLVTPPARTPVFFRVKVTIP